MASAAPRTRAGTRMASAAAVLAVRVPVRVRGAALAAVLASLSIAPATWAVQTLGHATNGTFPAGGPVATGFGGAGGPGGPGAGGRFAPGGAPRGGAFGPAGGPPPGAGGPGGAGGRGGGMFGGDSAAVTQAVSYARAHGGGTIAVSSQSGASATIIASGADVAAIGGFSGRESEVSVSWLADAVRSGRIRWVLTDSGGPGGGMRNDGRVGATTAMSAVAQACTATGSASAGSAVTTSTGLYDCLGHADALAAAAVQ